MKRVLIVASTPFRFGMICCVLLSACGAVSTSAPTTAPTEILQFPTPQSTTNLQSPVSTHQPPITNSQLPFTPTQILQFSTPRSSPNLQSFDSAQDKSPVSNSPTPTLDPSGWKSLPIIPAVDPSIRAVYEYGQTLGNDPRAFSIFGDCQTRPEEFFGILETNPAVLMNLSPELNETIENFHGSFNRESPTAQDGMTPGALLWTQWHQGNFTCTFEETPVECELRIHRPSFVIIQVGTHFESRNTEYLRKIILQLMDAGVVPILATKADNRELDDRVNRDMAMLAAEYDLPLWNFWAALSDLPDRGLYTRDDRPLQGAIYLNPIAARRHWMTGLEALNAVWRAAAGK